MNEVSSQIFGFLAPILLVSVIFILFVFRPQQKKISTHKKFLSELKEGDKVVLYGGLIGIIKKIENDIVTIDSGGSIIKVLKQYISEGYIPKSEGS